MEREEQMKRQVKRYYEVDIPEDVHEDIHEILKWIVQNGTWLGFRLNQPKIYVKATNILSWWEKKSKG